jgi:hypothetical protein
MKAGMGMPFPTDEVGARAVEKGVEMPGMRMPWLQMRSVAMR